VDRGPMPERWDWPLESPLRLRTNAVTIDWTPTLEKALPQKRITEGKRTQTITLVPYGCTKLRVSMFPVTGEAIAPSQEVVDRMMAIFAQAKAKKKAELARRQAEWEKSGVKEVSPPDESEGWGKERDGLRTRLVPTQEQYVVGQPARFRLEMKNFGKLVRAFDSQSVDVNNSIEITGPDGKSVPYVAGLYQTAGETRYIEPGQTAILSDRLDLADQYLITSRGTYTLRFVGRNVIWDMQSAIPPSAKIAIAMRPGTLPREMQVPARLIEILPANWHTSLNMRVAEVQDGKITPPGCDSGLGTYLASDSDTAGKEGRTKIQFWVADRELVAKDAKGEQRAEFLGKGADGYVYWIVPKEAKKAWPDVEKKVRAALKIEPAGTAK
jgi:hypothetical protein